MATSCGFYARHGRNRAVENASRIDRRFLLCLSRKVSMKTLAVFVAVAAVGWVGTPLAEAQGGPITAATGPPELIETGGAGASFAMTEAEYQQLAARLAKMDSFVPMTTKPDGVSANVRFGVNFVFGGKNRSWALDGDEAHGYTLYADLNAN